jgi:hypothetical protein
VNLPLVNSLLVVFGPFLTIGVPWWIARRATRHHAEQAGPAAARTGRAAVTSAEREHAEYEARVRALLTAPEWPIDRTRAGDHR